MVESIAKLLLTIPSYYHNNVIRALLELRDENSFLDLLSSQEKYAFFVPAQFCTRGSTRRSASNTYHCVLSNSPVNTLIQNHIYERMQKHAQRVSRILATLENECGSKHIAIYIHTELRFPMWHDKRFVAVYARLLEALNEIFASEGVEVEEVNVELHPGFPKTECWYRRTSECYNARLIASILGDALSTLASRCKGCTFTIENRSSAPRISRRILDKLLSTQHDVNVSFNYWHGSMGPQALRTFDDVFSVLSLLRPRMPRVYATFDLPQHVEGIVKMKNSNEHLSLDMFKVLALHESRRIAELLHGRELLGAIHIHWWGEGLRGRPVSHYVVPPGLIHKVYSPVVFEAAKQGDSNTVYIVPEALPSGGGFRETIEMRRRRLAMLVDNLVELASVILSALSN